jgi:hypothetical protein
VFKSDLRLKPRDDIKKPEALTASAVWLIKRVQKIDVALKRIEQRVASRNEGRNQEDHFEVPRLAVQRLMDQASAYQKRLNSMGWEVV